MRRCCGIGLIVLAACGSSRSPASGGDAGGMPDRSAPDASVDAEPDAKRDAGKEPRDASQDADAGMPFKFNPGMYIELDPGSGGGGLTGWLSTVASLSSQPYVRGVMLIQPWSSLEFDEGVYTRGSGSSAQGFAMVDQLVAACASLGKQFILGYEDRSFGAAQTWTTPTSFGQLPAYFDTLESGSPGYVDAPSGTTFMGEGLQMIADVWDPVVTAREIALATAYGGRYDRNQNFEMWSTPETACAAPQVGDYDAYVMQLQAWMKGARAAFAHTEIRISSNFLDTAAQFTTLFGTAITYGVGQGGPDVKLNLVGDPPFPGTACIVFDGTETGKDYRGILPWISEVQYPDLNGSATEEQLYSFTMTGDASTCGSMGPNYFIWSQASESSEFTLKGTLAFIASVKGAVNTARPSALP
jgi:hypothetical protein